MLENVVLLSRHSVVLCDRITRWSSGLSRRCGGWGRGHRLVALLVTHDCENKSDCQKKDGRRDVEMRFLEQADWRIEGGEGNRKIYNSLGTEGGEIRLYIR